jgi:hypothetical protein
LDKFCFFLQEAREIRRIIYGQHTELLNVHILTTAVYKFLNNSGPIYVVVDDLECSAVFRLHCKELVAEKLPHRIGAVHHPELPGNLDV